MEKLKLNFFVGYPGALTITLPIVFVPVRFALLAWTKYCLSCGAAILIYYLRLDWMYNGFPSWDQPDHFTVKYCFVQLLSPATSPLPSQWMLGSTLMGLSRTATPSSCPAWTTEPPASIPAPGGILQSGIYVHCTHRTALYSFYLFISIYS